MKNYFVLLLNFVFFTFSMQNITFADEPDITPPEIDLTSIELRPSKIDLTKYKDQDPQYLINKEILSMELHDNKSGIDMSVGHVVVLYPDQTVHKSYGSPIENGSDRYEFLLPLTQYATPGSYKIVRIVGIKDRVGNISPEQDLTNLNLSFEVLTESPDSNPPRVDVNSIKLSSKIITPHDFLEISVDIPDDISGVEHNGSVAIIQAPRGTLVYAHSGANMASSWKQEIDTRDTVRFRLYPNEFSEPGTYTIIGLDHIIDYAGNITPPTDLRQSKLTFEVNNPNFDITPPTVSLSSIKLSDQHVYPGDNISLLVRAFDDISGVNRGNYAAKITIQSPNGSVITSNYVDFDYSELGNNVSLAPRATIKQFAIPGIYKVISLEGIHDNAENFLPPLDLLPLNLNFEVLESKEKSPAGADNINQEKANESKADALLINNMTTDINNQPLTPEEKQTLTKNIESMHDLITEKVEKAKSEQDPSTPPKNLALQYCVQDLENFLEQHQAELTRYIAQLQKQGAIGQIDITQNLHEQLLDLQTLKYVLLMISEAWDTYDNDDHPNDLGKHETELSKEIADKFDEFIGRKDSQCFNLPGFLDLYEKLVINQTLKTKEFREKLEKNPELTGASHPEVNEDLRDILVPLQSSTITFWHRGQSPEDKQPKFSSSAK